MAIMAIYRSQIVIPTASQLPSDVVTNTLHWLDPDGAYGYNAAIATLTVLIGNFYEAVYSSGHGMADYMRPANGTIRWYNLEDPAPRPPTIVPWGATPITQSSTNVPAETSCVLSFQAERLAGAVQARRRGRIYLGGLGTGWVGNSTAATPPRLATSAVNEVGNAANTMRLGVPGALQWVVWSETGNSYAIVTNGWVDQEPDTQRRRGWAPAGRDVWP